MLDQPRLHCLLWGNILSLNGSCLTLQTEKRALLGLASVPSPSPEPLPSQNFSIALPPPPWARAPTCFLPKKQRPGTEGRSSTKPACPFPVPSRCFPGGKRDLAQGWGTTSDFPVLSQPSISPLFLSSHEGLISHLSVLWGWKTFFLLILAPVPDSKRSPTQHPAQPLPMPPTSF